MSEKILLVIDGDNFFYSQKEIGFQIDPAKLRDYISNMGKLTNSYYYLSVPTTALSGEKAGYLKALTYIGYKVISRPIKCIRLASGNTMEKASVDCKIAVDIMCAMNQFDTLVMVSGDSDFIPIYETLAAMGKKFKVLSSDGMVAKEIREICGNDYIDLASLKSHIEKERIDEEA